ncbi:TetR/AcrR family transcriptional regulator [Microbacterium pumilum]|uniref:TetR/AcrR family transcriptional regulator n=1 Tax=Microbacterium pumilum TaxID=344165 RepID=A0ABN2T3Z0_9MICO
MDDTGAGDPDLPRGIALAWGIAADPQRGPKREMSVESIVDAAVELADAEGLGAVSMAAVAARLGYTPMSLYRYVTAKDDLILLMQEEATGLPPEHVREVQGWRGQLEALYRAMVQMYVEHSWMLDIQINGSPTTPNSAAWMDAGLAALADTPLSQPERLSIMLFITGQARWCGSILASYARIARDEHMADDEISRREDALFRRLITAEAYPALRAAIDDGVFLSTSDPFTFGLERGLDGIQAYLPRAAAGRHDQPRPWGADDGAEIAGDKRFREARKAVREAEKSLRDARKLERIAARDARERVRRARTGA